MDHNEAIRLQAAEKYALGELQGTSREEFEEHFFDCGECAHDMKALAIFLDNTKEVLWQQRARETDDELVPERARWFRWLKPIVAVPAFAVLVLALGYQSFVTVPHWKNAATQATAARVLLPYSLIGANARGPEGRTFQVRRNEPFSVSVDVPADAAYGTYVLRLEDPAGNSQILRTISYAQAQKTVVVEVPLGDGSGTYEIVVVGMAGEEKNPAQGATLATMKFHVELLK